MCRYLFQVQGEKAADRSRANPQERLQYLAAGTVGAAAPQGGGDSQMSIAAARFLTFICLINRELFILQAIPNAHHGEMVFSSLPHLPVLLAINLFSS